MMDISEDKNLKRKEQEVDDTTTTTTSTTTNNKRVKQDQIKTESNKPSNNGGHIKQYFKGKFIHGNYKNYYKYRHENGEEDPRFQILTKDIFEGKRCLDIGCNSGLLDLKIAIDYGAKYVKGIDIDLDLIKQANGTLRNERLKLYNIKNNINQPIKQDNSTNTTESEQNKQEITATTTEPEQKNESSKVDEKMEIQENHNRLSTPTSTTSTTTTSTITEKDKKEVVEESKPFVPVSFKYLKFNDKKEEHLKFKEMNKKLDGYLTNIAFYQQDFLIDLPKFDTGASFDVIMALSVSKWVHLNNGDEGIKKFFAKVYRLLKPGGTFIFEPQEFKGYSKRKGLSKEIRNNFENIKLKPKEFIDYLIKEVGFKEAIQLDKVEGVKAKGFERNIYKLLK